MSTMVRRTARAATAGLLGLLVSAPPPAAADDDDRRSRAPAVRGDRDREDRGRDERHRELRRGDRGRDHRRDGGQRRVDRDRYEHRGRPGPPTRVVRDQRKHDHRHEHRDDRRWREVRRDHREWREDRKWRPAHVTQYDERWHWHDGRWCPPGHRNPPGRRVGWTRPHDDWRWARYRRPVVVHSPYYCAPCSNWYGQRHDFDRHLYGYHRLPQRSFQDAVSQAVWGLVYFGL